MSITLIASFNIKEGKMGEALNLLKQIVPKVRETEAGCLAYIAHTVTGAKNKNTIVFYEKYKDKEAMNVHSANFPKNFEKVFPLLDGKMDLKTCVEII